MYISHMHGTNLTLIVSSCICVYTCTPTCLGKLQIISSGGLVGDHEKYSVATALLSKGLDDEASMPHEASAAAYDFYGHGGGAGDEILQASPEASSCKSQLSQMLLQAAASSPRSCVTTSGLGSSMMEFSNTAAVAPAAEPELTRKHHAGQSDNSSEVRKKTNQDCTVKIHFVNLYGNFFFLSTFSQM